MNFVSDNAYGAAPEILEALRTESSGTAASYGEDEMTARLQRVMSRIFEREVAVYPVVTGTAANALAIATLTPPHGAVLCHRDAHIAVDECGAPEFFSHGARLVAIGGQCGKLRIAAIEAALSRFQKGSVHNSQPSMVSLTQATESGTCYDLDEITAISALARKHDLSVHMDGARFANALAHLDCTPADATWRAGVDVLSFGATKNGALCAEAVVFFHRGDARDFEYRRKKAGHLLSKMRFVSVQLVSYLENGRWLAMAERANLLARRLGRGLSELSGVEIAYPVEANAVFAHLPDGTVARLRAAGALFYDWPSCDGPPPAPGCSLVRLVTSFATPDDDVEQLLAIARG